MREEQDALFQLTHPQKRIWYLENMYPGSPVFNVGGPIRIHGPVDFGLLAEAVRRFVCENDGMRIRLSVRGSEVFQYIGEYKEFTPSFTDFSRFGDPEGAFREWVREQAETPFELRDSDLFQFAFFRLSEEECGYLPKCHHLIADGWSMMLLSQQVSRHYEQLLAEGTNTRPAAAPSYVRFIRKEAEYLASERFHKDKEFWNGVFRTMPADFDGSSAASIEGKRKTFTLDPQLSGRIRQAAKGSKVSLNTFFVLMYLLYVYKTTGQNDLIIGTPVLNRSGGKEKNTVGMFVNATPCRFVLDEDGTAEEALLRVNESLMKYFLHQKYPYDLLVKELGLKKSGIDNLYNVCVNYYHTRLSNEMNGIPMENTEFYNGCQVYSMQMVIKDWSDSGSMTIDIDYKTADYTERQIEAMMESVSVLMERILEDASVPLAELSLVSPRMREELLYRYNDTASLYSASRTMADLIRDQVRRTPDRIAAGHGSRSITYRELDEGSNRMARTLLAKGSRPGEIVGMYVRHSIEMVVGVLAVLKAGAAYMPIAVDTPEDRIRYMLDQSGCRLLLANVPMDFRRIFEGDILRLDDDAAYAQDGSGFATVPGPRDLAYLIYTSGSTGAPKGVMIEHRSLLNYIEWAKRMYVRHEDDVFALYSSFAFDLTVTSIFTPLIGGQRMEIYSQEDAPDEFVLYRIWREAKATIVKLTPSHLALLRDMDLSGSAVRTLIVGGENLATELADAIVSSSGGRIGIYNEYGPTEATVGCMIHRYTKDDLDFSSVPLGAPAANTQIYILDKRLQPVPPGVVGEMYISGDSLARGYYNRPDLTEKAFLQNPFIEGELMYKTGDLARFTEGYAMLYLGRADHQVKIRGHRIELGEMERELERLEEVGRAVAVCREEEKTGRKYLCAYVARRAGGPRLDPGEIREFLQRRLPGYMVPSFVMELDEIPLTPNGKVNLALLPEPEPVRENAVQADTARTPDEEALLLTLAGILRLDRAGLGDDFFHLGGDSITAIQLSNRLAERGYRLRVQDILANPKLKAMAGRMAAKCEAPSRPEDAEGEVRPSPVISWFCSRGFADAHYYNQSLLLSLKRPFTPRQLEDALQALVRQHDAFRLNLEPETGRLFYNPAHLDGRVRLLVYDWSGLSLAGQEEEFRLRSRELKGGIRIDRDILLRAALMHMGKTVSKLLVTAHHLAVDGVSWRILLDHLEQLLDQVWNGRELALPKKSHSYKVWTDKLHGLAQALPPERRRYWQEAWSGYTEPMEKHDGEEVRLRSYSVSLGEERTSQLLTAANRAYGTRPEELLLAALALALKTADRREDIWLEVEKHGRDQAFDGVDFSGTIGWFTSLYPLKLAIGGEGLVNTLKSLKEQIREAGRHGLDYGLIKYYLPEGAALAPGEWTGIRFNYLGSFSPVTECSSFSADIRYWEDDRPPCNADPAVLEINSFVADGRLHISAAYGYSEFRGLSAEGLLKRYARHVEELLDHCCQKEGREFTPSDFDTAGLHQDELDSLFA